MYQIVSRYITTGEIIFGKIFECLEDVTQAVKELNEIYDRNNFPMYASYIKKK